MKCDVTSEQIDRYRRDGFLVIDNFLTPSELAEWRSAVCEAVEERDGVKIPGTDLKTGHDDGINQDTDYYANVFDQLINLWQTNRRVRKLMMSPQLGKAAALLSGAKGIRIWHDQALFKGPWGNPTGLHLDVPYWSFNAPDAISIWVALDDATPDNGCLYFLPGTHQKTGYRDVGITKNMKAIFTLYPELAALEAVAAPMKAGSASFHNGLTIHGAGANMTPRPRRAMTCAYMPEGATFNGQKNVLPDAYLKTLSIGDPLDNDEQNPLLWPVIEAGGTGSPALTG
jgi:ectoine hydroxylase-related dioxygenase (phytanoyl-CoA dioxygenase family)